MSNFKLFVMYKNKLLTGLFIGGLLVIASCKKDKTVTTTVFVSTSAMTNITSASAHASGDVDLAGVEDITERGFCWATTEKPTVTNDKTTAPGTGRGNFTADITGLTAGALYYVRAYVINNGQTFYGNQVKFTASVPVELIKNGDFTLPDDNVKYLTLNSVPEWHTDDPSMDLTGREYDAWKNSGCAYINDWANFYQVVGDVPAAQSDYKIKFDASYVWTDWAPYAPKFYVTFSTFTTDPSTRTAIGSVEVASLPEYPADATTNWKTYEADFSIPAGSAGAGQKLVIEWSLENYKTESWGWSNTWYDFDNISVMQTIK
jgi:hypothetical protein